jgi:hypothetical protein
MTERRRSGESSFTCSPVHVTRAGGEHCQESQPVGEGERMVAVGQLPAVDTPRPAGATRGRWSAWARGRDPALLLAVLPALLLHALVAVRGTAGAPSAYEASTVAAAHDAAQPVAAADIAFVRQLAAAQSALGPAGGADLLQTARALCLLAGVLTALLLWPIARRLLVRRDAAATAVVVAGSTPVALMLHAQVDAGAFAALWLVAAAAVATATELRPSDTVPLAVAAVGLGCAVLTAPLVAVGLLAFAAHRLATRLPVPGGGKRRARIVIAAMPAAAAAGIAALALTRTSPATAAGSVDVPLLVTTVVLAGVITALAHWRVIELRALSTAAAAWLACALCPGPAQLTALLLALPMVALLAGALVGRSTHPVPLGAGVAVTAALATGVLAATSPAALRPMPTHDGVARLLDSTSSLQAAALDRAELVSRGVAPARFVAGAAAPGTVRIVMGGGCAASETVLGTVPGLGGGIVLCHVQRPAPPRAPASPPAPPTTLPPGFGATLATNPALTLSRSARAALVEGRVDDRLAMVLAGATALHEVTIEDFPAGTGDAPLTSAVVVATRADTGLAAYFAGQMPPYRPDVTLQPGGRLVLSFG